MDHKFKCCNKSFVHYVCINCNEVIHRYCASKLKKEIRFLSDNKIMCCDSTDSSNESTINDPTETLEKTIQELIEDRQTRDRHLEKLKRDREVLVMEATAREDELNELVTNQEAKIRQLQELVAELKLSLEVYTERVAQTAWTQTTVDTISVSTITDGPPHMVLGPVHVDETRRLVTDQWTMTDTPKDPAGDCRSSCSKKCLVVSDDYGRNIARLLSRKFDADNFKIESVYKPGATYQQVIENLEGLCRDYTRGDYVVIIAGNNNFTGTTRYPLFKDLCDKIKKCSNLNLILVNVPYKKEPNVNQFIYKFNQKLSDFVAKVNNFIPGRIEIIDVNGIVGVTKRGLCQEIIRVTRNTRNSLSNLVFVETDATVGIGRDYCSGQESEGDAAARTSAVITEMERGGDASVSNTSFLYPRLSQLRMED